MTKPKNPKQMAPLTPAVDPRPEPHDKEQARMTDARERWIERTPPVQTERREDGAIRSPHNDDSGWTMRLGDAFGTRSPEFMSEALTALNAAARSRGTAEATSQQLNTSLALVSAIAPENELEAALAVQMAASHALATDVLGRAAGTDKLEYIQLYGNLAVKLQRTFTAQIEALARMRGKGQQTVRVEHVTVQAGAQAIVGDVHHHSPGRGGVQSKNEAQPHGTSEFQERAALPCPDTEGNGVPIAGDAERPMSAPRRALPGRPNRKSERA